MIPDGSSFVSNSRRCEYGPFLTDLRAQNRSLKPKMGFSRLHQVRIYV